MIRVGIAGVGFMGLVHYLTYQKLRGVKVTALSTRSAKRRGGDWTDIQGNFGPRGTKMDLSQLNVYEEFDDLVADPQVDLIDLCVPPGQHAEFAIKALKGGKHVFCEKPMALETAQCARMQRTADAAGRRLWVGHVLPFMPEYDWAYRTIRGGKYGRLLGGNFRRVISDPTWLPDYWKKEVGGPMLDLHVHDAHFIRLLFGKPTWLSSQGRMRKGMAEHWTTQFRFRNSRQLATFIGGVTNQQGRAFNHGFEIHLEKATILFEFAVIGGEGKYLCAPTILDDHGRALAPKLSEGDPMNAFVGEIRQVLRDVKGKGSSPLLGSELAADAVMICHKQSQSLRQGKPVSIK